MRHITCIAILTGMLASTPAFAGAGHEHGDEDAAHSHGPITGEAATTKATEKVKQLIEAGKLEKSWSTAKATGVTQKTFSKGPEWVVTFVNDQISDKTKQTLYVFYSQDGHYLAANFSGK